MTPPGFRCPLRDLPATPLRAQGAPGLQAHVGAAKNSEKGQDSQQGHSQPARTRGGALVCRWNRELAPCLSLPHHPSGKWGAGLREGPRQATRHLLPRREGKQSWHVHRKSFRASRISNGLMVQTHRHQSKATRNTKTQGNGTLPTPQDKPHQRTKAHQTPVSYLTDEAKELSSRSRELILDRVPEHTTGAGQPFHK